MDVSNTDTKQDKHRDYPHGSARPLHTAAKYDYTEAIQALLENRANIEGKDADDATPLHIAAQNGYTRVVEALIQARATIDATDKEGLTPLHIAAALKPSWRDKFTKNDQIDIIKYLLSQGANKDVTNNEGKKPYDLIAEEETELRKLLSLGE